MEKIPNEEILMITSSARVNSNHSNNNHSNTDMPVVQGDIANEVRSVSQVV